LAILVIYVNLVTVPLLDQPLQLSGTRERKKVQRFTEEFKSEPKDAIIIEIPEGKGTALGDIPRIDALLQVSEY
jgi:Mrp family chromosome partitioning ATPase